MDTNTFVLASGSAPTLGFIGWVIIGGLAGWIGSKIMKTDKQMGVMLNIVVGVIGGFIGGWLLSLINIDVAGGGLWLSFFTCLIGAVVFLWILGAVSGKKK